MIKYIIVHNTGGVKGDAQADTSHHTFEIVNNGHRNKWNFESKLGYYIGYQYFIQKNGRLKQGRKDDEEGAHTKGYNNDSIGICLAGNFNVTYPTSIQKEVLGKLLVKLVDQHKIEPRNIYPHRQFANKSCFGLKLKDNWARNLYFNEKLGRIRAMLKRLLELISNRL